MSDFDIESFVRGHSTRNEELRDKLAKRGIDLKVPRSIEHHFWAKTKRDAALLGNELYKRGYLLLTLAPATVSEGHEHKWNIEAGSRDSVEHASSDDLANELVRLADAFNGRYDGWGTSI
jgi:regulator of RNase E activity RraB